MAGVDPKRSLHESRIQIAGSDYDEPDPDILVVVCETISNQTFLTKVRAQAQSAMQTGCLTRAVSVRPHLAHARRLHRRRDSIDDREARPTAPSRGGIDRRIAERRFWEIPVVRRPNVAGWIDLNRPGFAGGHFG